MTIHFLSRSILVDSKQTTAKHSRAVRPIKLLSMNTRKATKGHKSIFHGQFFRWHSLNNAELRISDKEPDIKCVSARGLRSSRINPYWVLGLHSQCSLALTVTLGSTTDEIADPHGPPLGPQIQIRHNSLWNMALHRLSSLWEYQVNSITWLAPKSELVRWKVAVAICAKHVKVFRSGSSNKTRCIHCCTRIKHWKVTEQRTILLIFDISILCFEATCRIHWSSGRSIRV